MKTRWLVMLVVASAVVALCGCATPVSDPAAAGGGNATVLMHVGVSDPHAPRNLPLSVQLEFIDMTTGERLDQAQQAAASTGAAVRDAHLRIDLPPGRYSLVRIHANLGAPSDGLQMGAIVGAPFEVKRHEVAFIGRAKLVVRQAAAGSRGPSGSHQLHVQYDADSARENDLGAWRAAWPDLKLSSVRTVELDRFEVVEARVHEPPAPPAPAPSLTAHGVANAAVTAQLPMPLRRHYQRFLRLQRPRAMAVGPAGQAGVSTGTAGAVERALSLCQASTGPEVPCTLLAVDNTLLADPSRLATSAQAGGR